MPKLPFKPYQEEKQDTSDASIYNYFYDLSEKIARQYCLISPARFLFNAGNTSKIWNEKMLNDPHLKVKFYEPISSNVFPPPSDIKGGIAVVYRDKDKNFGKIGTFTSFFELNGIIQKVANKDNFSSIVPIIHLQLKFNLKELYLDYPDLCTKIGSQGKEKRLTTSIFDTVSEIFSDTKRSDDIEVLGLIKNQRLYKFVNKRYLEPHQNLGDFKVILPKSNGSGAIGEVLSTPLIGQPLIGHTQSFISIGSFKTEKEAENCLKYVKSKFARTMLGVLKVTQDNNPPTWAKVPLQDFTENSDIDWTKSIAEIDQQLYQKYDLDEKEIAFIEEKVKAMD